MTQGGHHEDDEGLGATGSTHSEIGAKGGGSPGGQAAAAKRDRTGEDSDVLDRARSAGDPAIGSEPTALGGDPTEEGVTEDGRH